MAREVMSRGFNAPMGGGQVLGGGAMPWAFPLPDAPPMDAPQAQSSFAPGIQSMIDSAMADPARMGQVQALLAGAGGGPMAIGDEQARFQQMLMEFLQQGSMPAEQLGTTQVHPDRMSGMPYQGPPPQGLPQFENTQVHPDRFPGGLPPWTPPQGPQPGTPPIHPDRFDQGPQPGTPPVHPDRAMPESLSDMVLSLLMGNAAPGPVHPDRAMPQSIDDVLRNYGTTQGMQNAAPGPIHPDRGQPFDAQGIMQQLLQPGPGAQEGPIHPDRLSEMILKLLLQGGLPGHNKALAGPPMGDPGESAGQERSRVRGTNPMFDAVRNNPGIVDLFGPPGR